MRTVNPAATARSAASAPSRSSRNRAARPPGTRRSYGSSCARKSSRIAKTTWRSGSAVTAAATCSKKSSRWDQCSGYAVKSSSAWSKTISLGPGKPCSSRGCSRSSRNSASDIASGRRSVELRPLGRGGGSRCRVERSAVDMNPVSSRPTSRSSTQFRRTLATNTFCTPGGGLAAPKRTRAGGSTSKASRSSSRGRIPAFRSEVFPAPEAA